jgi:hypothetical protein
MATAATRKSIIDLVVLATGGAPGTTKLGELIVLSDSGKTLAEIADTQLLLQTKNLQQNILAMLSRPLLLKFKLYLRTWL